MLITIPNLTIKIYIEYECKKHLVDKKEFVLNPKIIAGDRHTVLANQASSGCDEPLLAFNIALLVYVGMNAIVDTPRPISDRSHG